MAVPAVPEGSYVVVVEPTETGYSAYLPDVPGCIATGGNQDEVMRNIRAALGLYANVVRDLHLELPPPQTNIAFISSSEAEIEEASVASSSSWTRANVPE